MQRPARRNGYVSSPISLLLFSFLCRLITPPRSHLPLQINNVAEVATCGREMHHTSERNRSRPALGVGVVPDCELFARSTNWQWLLALWVLGAVLWVCWFVFRSVNGFVRSVYGCCGRSDWLRVTRRRCVFVWWLLYVCLCRFDLFVMFRLWKKFGIGRFFSEFCIYICYETGNFLWCTAIIYIIFNV